MKRKFCFLRVIGHPYLSYDAQEELKRAIEPLIYEWVELDDDDPTFQYMMRPNDLVTGSHQDGIVVLELLEERETSNSTVTVETLMEAAKAEVAKDKKRLEAAAARKQASAEKKAERLKKKYEELKSVFEPIPPDQKPDEGGTGSGKRKKA